MANLIAQRNALASALAAAGRVVLAYPAENITAPALVLVPGQPYIEPEVIGPSGGRLKVRFEITAIVGAADNQAALANMEKLMLDTLVALPIGVALTSWSQPQITQVGNSDMLTSQLSVELTTNI